MAWGELSLGGQIDLLDNPLLREPLALEHIKPRLLGHWDATPGLNFIYAHVNRLIGAWDRNVIYVAGPGHCGPGLVANTYLEGTSSEVYPHIGRDVEGLGRLFRQFSFPVGSRVMLPRRRWGRSTRRASWAMRSGTPVALRLTIPICWCAAWSATARTRTGALAASWHSAKFLHAARDGAVLPIWHLNRYKIVNPDPSRARQGSPGA